MRRYIFYELVNNCFSFFFPPNCPLMSFAHLYIRAFFENIFAGILNIVKMLVFSEIVLNE